MRQQNQPRSSNRNSTDEFSNHRRNRERSISRFATSRIRYMIKSLFAMPHTALQGAGRKEVQGSHGGMISTKPPPIPGHAMQQQPLQQKPPRVNTHIPIRIRSTSIRTACWPIKLPPVDTFPQESQKVQPSWGRKSLLHDSVLYRRKCFTKADCPMDPWRIFMAL